ncbi:15374_t:CDS:2, partial [Acaulospora colombiana]
FVKFSQIAEENAENAKLRDGKLNARIVELEQSAKKVKIDLRNWNRSKPSSSDQSNLSCDISREQKNDQSKSQNASSGSLQNSISQSKNDLVSKLDQSKIKSPCLEPKLSIDQVQNDIPELSNILSQIAKASTLVKIPYNQRVEQ